MIPLLVKRESTGFIFSRVWRAIKKESFQTVDEGVASVEDVDRAWIILTKYPIGPFGTMGQVGDRPLQFWITAKTDGVGEALLLAVFAQGRDG